jgi:hypothetical protein
LGQIKFFRLIKNIPPVIPAGHILVVTAAVAAIPALTLACLAAIGAAGRLVSEALFLIESLFAFSENEFLSTVLANQSFICHFRL